MAKYETGIRTKNKILKACKKLFYAKGYDGTTYNDICRQASVNRGLIHYHFQGKYNIGRLIFSTFLSDNNDVVRKLVAAKCPDTPVQYMPALNLRSYLNLLLKEDKLRRFYYQISKVTEFNISHIDVGEAAHRRYFDAFGIDSTETELKFAMAAVMGMSSSTNIMYLEGHLDMPLEEYIDHRIKLFYSVMHVDKATIDKIVEDSKKIYASLNIGVKKYFNPYAVK